MAPGSARSMAGAREIQQRQMLWRTDPVSRDRAARWRDVQPVLKSCLPGCKGGNGRDGCSDQSGTGAGGARAWRGAAVSPQVSAALRRHGVVTTLLAGDATPAGLSLPPATALPSTPSGWAKCWSQRSLQWTPEPLFAVWLSPRLAPATWFTPTWWGHGGLRHRRCHLGYRWWPANITRCPGLAAITPNRPGPRRAVSTCCSAMGRRSAPGRLGWAWTAGGVKGAQPCRACRPGPWRACPRPGSPSPAGPGGRGLRRARGGPRPARHAPTCLPPRRRPHARNAGPAVRARGLQAVVSFPGWSYGRPGTWQAQRPRRAFTGGVLVAKCRGGARSRRPGGRNCG